MHRIGPFSKYKYEYEYSISQFKTKEEIKVTMDEKSELVLLYFIAFLIYREVSIKFIQKLYYGL